MSAAAIEHDNSLCEAVRSLTLSEGFDPMAAVDLVLDRLRTLGRAPSELGISRAREAAKAADRERRQAAHDRRLAREARRARFSAVARSAKSAAGPPDPIAFNLETEEGLLGDLARWSLDYAFRPIREFAVLTALATLAPLYARRFATPTDGGLNLYLIGLAETGSGKEAVIGAPPAALEAAKLDFLIGAGDFTSDSAIELALRSRPNFLAPIDEVGEFIGTAQHRNAAAHSRTIRKAILDLYGKSRPGARWTGKQKVELDRDKAADPVFSPSLSILGCSTITSFFEGLTEANFSDGLINRLVVFRGGKPGRHNLNQARYVVPADLAKSIERAYADTARGNLAPAGARCASAKPAMQAVGWEDETAIAAWSSIVDWETVAKDEGREGVAGRAAENTLKIATLRALSRDGLAAAVTEEDVCWAWGIVRPSVETVERGAKENMAGSEFEGLVKAMERAIIEAGPHGIAWSKLVEKRGVGKHTPTMVKAARERLEHRRFATWEIRQGPNGGRPGERVVAQCFHPNHAARE